MAQLEAGGRFIRSGFWLLFLGFVMSFGMVLHYVVGAQYPTGEKFLKNVTLWYACPWTLSTSVVLFGALCMILIGAVYMVLDRHPTVSQTKRRAPLALLFCTLSLVGMFLTGYVGYFVVDKVWRDFYYSPITEGKNVWLFLQLACMVLYAFGVVLAFRDIRRATRA